MLNLPSGKMLYKNLDLNTVDFIKIMLELQNKRVTGYAAVCIKGVGGFEEGTVLYDAGKIVGCVYEYYKHDRQFEAGEAFQRILNASAAKNGVIDVVELSAEQVQLALAVNQKMIFVPDQKQLEQVKVESFSPLFEEQLLEEKPREGERKELLNKYKLGGLV